jgi:DNA-binding response OmpR family regulator
MSYRLLLADDSVTIQRVIELTFADEDIAVTSVGDGHEAVRRIVADPPDIVLADIDLPQRDGYDIASFVKNDPELSQIPVVLLAGAFDPVDEARARSVRSDGILSKPFDPQVLIARVRELLGRLPAAPADSAEVGRPGADEPAAQESDSVREDLPLEYSSLECRPEAPASQETSLDEYFDQLDAAFAHLTGAPPAHDAAAAVPAVPGAPAGHVSPGRGAGAGSAVSEAFAALLDAEQTLGPEGARGTQVDAPPAAPAIDDAFIDEVARRVSERIGETALRAEVSEIVSTTAERLIREEIERIKNSIE